MSNNSTPLQRAQERYDGKNPSVTLRLARVLPEVDARTPADGVRSDAVRRDLGRYYQLMRLEVTDAGFSHSELCAILNACRGMYMLSTDEVDGAFVRGRVADLEDAGPLLDKLRPITIAQTYALADLICMYGCQEQDASPFLRGLGYVD